MGVSSQTSHHNRVHIRKSQWCSVDLPPGHWTCICNVCCCCFVENIKSRVLFIPPYRTRSREQCSYLQVTVLLRQPRISHCPTQTATYQSLSYSDSHSSLTVLLRPVTHQSPPYSDQTVTHQSLSYSDQTVTHQSRSYSDQTVTHQSPSYSDQTVTHQPLF